MRSPNWIFLFSLSRLIIANPYGHIYNDSVEKYIKCNGTASIYVSHSDYYQFSSMCLLPDANSDKYSLLNSVKPFYFARMSLREVNNLSLETQIIPNSIISKNTYINLLEIPCIKDEYSNLIKGNKFEIQEKKTLFLTNLINCQKLYKTELHNYKNSIWAVSKFTNLIKLSDSLYNIDNRTFTFRIPDDDKLQENVGYGTAIFYGTSINRMYLEQFFPEIVLSSVTIKYPVEKAKTLFSSNDSLCYCSYFYVQPTDSIWEQPDYVNCQVLIPQGLVVHIINPKKNILLFSIVCHHIFKQPNKREPFSWSTNVIYYNSSQNIDSGYSKAENKPEPENLELNPQEWPFCGIWEYEEYGTKQYFKIIKEENKLKFLIGSLYNGDIIWDNQPFLKNTDGIYLKRFGNQLKANFISSNFYPTHGKEFSYKISLDKKSKDILLYSVYSSIRGENKIKEAKRISSDLGHSNY